MVFEYKNSRGIKYYLHRKGKLLFFSKKADGAISLPDGMSVVENHRTGLPMAKKK